MQLRAQQLDSHLAGTLRPIYLVTGDETLLLEECCDAILAAARGAGFEERTVFAVESGFRWTDLNEEAAALSLFASRRLFDVRLPTNKVDREASEVLRGIAAEPPPDTLLLLRVPRLDGKQKQSAWYKALDAAGVILTLWPISVDELPRWLNGRLRRAGLELTRDALAHLADLTEGNLLAAKQEIDKLRLADLPQPIELEPLLEATADAATYGAFDLIDAVMLGQGERVARMVLSQQAEGVSLFALQGALRSQLKRISGGGAVYGPKEKQRAVAVFRRRTAGEPALVAEVMAQLALLDSQAKGAYPGDPWISFERLLLRLAGCELSTLDEDLRRLQFQ